MKRLSLAPFYSLRTPIFTFLLALSAAAVSIGFALSAGDFAGNLLAEIAGGIGGFFVALLVAEQVLARERRMSTEALRNMTVEELRTHLFKIASEFASYGTSDELLKAMSLGGTEAFAAVILNHWRERVEQLDEEDAPSRRRINDEVLGIHELAEIHILQIVDRIYPRLLEIGNEPSITSMLAELDHSTIVGPQTLSSGSGTGTRFLPNPAATLMSLPKLSTRSIQLCFFCRELVFVLGKLLPEKPRVPG